jgi:tetratricopeptide (TPR) repeat protein
MGILYLNFLNRPDSALFYFKKALDYSPEYPEALLNAGHSELALKNPVQAEQYFERLIAIDSLNAEVYLGLAEISAYKNNLSKAINYAIKSGQLDTLSDKPCIQTGNYYLLQKDTVNAVNFWEQAILRNPNNPNLLYGLSRYYFQTKNIEKSKKYETLYQRYHVE